MKYKIKKLIQETEDTRTFMLVPIKGKAIDFVPGQFVMLTAELEVNGKLQTVKRAYSMSSIPNGEFIDLTIKQLSDGLMSKHVMTLKKGDIMEIDGPYGKYLYEKGMKDVVMIAGGFGVMPFKSMISFMINNNIDVNMTMVTSARFPEDVIFEKEFNQFVEEHKNIKFFATYTQVKKNPKYGLVGRLDKEKFASMIKGIKKQHYFLCGSKKFVDGVIETLIGMGVDKKKIKIVGY